MVWGVIKEIKFAIISEKLVFCVCENEEQAENENDVIKRDTSLLSEIGYKEHRMNKT